MSRDRISYILITTLADYLASLYNNLFTRKMIIVICTCCQKNTPEKLYQFKFFYEVIKFLKELFPLAFPKQMSAFGWGI